MTCPSKKLSKKYLGLYEIIVQPSSQSFTLHLPDIMRAVHPVFHVSMLEPATPNTFQQHSKPPPVSVIIDREPEYEISKIVDSKIDCQRACKLLYKVIWLGYEDTDNDSEWLPATELEHAKELVNDFHLKYLSKLGPLWPWNTLILLSRLYFSAFTLLQKKKKKILEYLYTFQSAVSFALTCLLVFHSTVSVAIWYLYFALQFPLQSDTCIQKQSPLQNLSTCISP